MSVMAEALLMGSWGWDRKISKHAFLSNTLLLAKSYQILPRETRGNILAPPIIYNRHLFATCIRPFHRRALICAVPESVKNARPCQAYLVPA